MQSFLGNFVKGDETLKKENLELKQQKELLLKENSILKESYLDKDSIKYEENVFGKFFSSMKNSVLNKPVSNSEKFKSFLYGNLFISNSINTKDVDEMNQLVIQEDDWSENKKLYLLKQRILQRNYIFLIDSLNANSEFDRIEKEIKELDESNDEIPHSTFEEWIKNRKSGFKESTNKLGSEQNIKKSNEPLENITRTQKKEIKEIKFEDEFKNSDEKLIKIDQKKIEVPIKNKDNKRGLKSKFFIKIFLKLMLMMMKMI